MKNIASNILIISVFVSSVLLISCVSQSKFAEEQKKRTDCEKLRDSLNIKTQKLTALSEELKSKNEQLERSNKELNKDTSDLSSQIRDIKQKLDLANRQYDELKTKYDIEKAMNSKDTKKTLSDLQATKESLLKLQNDLTLKEKNIDEMSEQLKLKQQKLNELQSILNRKDSAVKALKDKVSDALLGFENKGLTIKIKNGKVYVSMEEALLFPSGSFTVTKWGAEALKKLALVLEANPDINILVEGHTDNVPYKGISQLKDNWDLSVMRATSVVKIIIDNSKVNPKRLTAAGESEYSPVDVNTTPDGRAKNRRTEIILTPKLDELFKIIETN